MKVAICFYGLVGSKTDKNGQGVSLDPKVAYKLNYENLIAGNDVDVFIHSWSHEHKKELIDLYEPKSHIIEKQRLFPRSSQIANNRTIMEKIRIVYSMFKKPLNISEQIQNKRKEAFRANSRWYSNKKVLELKAQYEKENNFKYDCVMVIRLDVGFYTPLKFSDYSMDHFYVSNWNDYPTASNDFAHNFKNHHLSKGFLDFWFFSNSEYMDDFSKLYDNIEKYHVVPHRSAYEHTITFTDKIEYIKYRWIDFEMIRRKEFKAEK